MVTKILLQIKNPKIKNKKSQKSYKSNLHQLHDYKIFNFFYKESEVIELGYPIFINKSDGHEGVL